MANSQKKIALLISALTVPASMSAIMLVVLWIFRPEAFRNDIKWLIVSWICLSVIGLLAYLLVRIVPSLRKGGRKTERIVAFVFALLGQLAGLFVAVFLNPPKMVFGVLIIYFISGLVLAIVNKVIHIKASGHACATTTPILIMIYYLGKNTLGLLLVLPLVYWSRLKMNRHTPSELILGTLIGAIVPIAYLVVV